MQTDPKTLARIKELIEQKERTDSELDRLIAGAEPPKRKWTRRNGQDAEQPQENGAPT